MDRRFITHYNRELQHLRENAGEFAREFPKIAGRLSLDEFACADPYVERLLEGFAFLTARIQLKLDAEFPRFTESLLNTVCPNYLAPLPSMVIAQFEPDYNDSSLADGFTIDRGQLLEAQKGKNDLTSCTFRTAHPTRLWPIKITEAAYYTRELAALDLPAGLKAKAGIRIRLQATAGLNFNKIDLDELVFFLKGSDEFPVRILEQVMTHTTHVIVREGISPPPPCTVLPASSVSRVGFYREESILPYEGNQFQGFRLLQEYFALPQRFMFFKVKGLEEGVQRVSGNQLDLILLFNQEDLEMEGRLSEGHFALHCTPAVNLFEKRCDRIILDEHTVEHQVLPDRTRPLDFEVYSLNSVTGFGSVAHQEQEFKPFHSSSDYEADFESGNAYYSSHRVSKKLSSRTPAGGRSSYLGSEVFIALADAEQPPYNPDLQQLAIAATCTNRDLPLQMPVGIGPTDFTLVGNAPVQAIKCLHGPTSPQASFAEGETTWRIINYLVPNYLSLVQRPGDTEEDGACLRDLLRLHCNNKNAQFNDQIEGLVSVSSRPVVRRISRSTPITFSRGLEIEVTFNEDRFEGTGVFILGMVLENLFARHASMNSFTETVIITQQRGEIVRWPARVGLKNLV